MATMADVARLAGVSVSTVSYTLTGTRPISQATRERIERAMAELGYTPNAFARGLKSKRSRILALLYPNLGASVPLSSVEYIFGASDHAQSLGYHLMLWTSDAEALGNLQTLAGQGLVDGTMMMEVRLQDPRIDVLRKAGLTFALIGRPEDPGDIDYVDADFAHCARTAIGHLAELGHRHIGFVNLDASALSAGRANAVRLGAEMVTAAAEMGLCLTSVSSAATIEGGAQSMTSLLVRDPDITAAISFNERALPGVMALIRAHGHDIPGDFSVLSVDLPAQAADLTSPPMTTVGPSGQEMGRAAADILIRRLNGFHGPRSQHLFGGRLVSRASTGPVRVHPSQAPESNSARERGSKPGR